MTRRRLVLSLGVMAVLAVSAAYWFFDPGSWSKGAGPHTLRADDPQTVRVGARIYEQRCAVCHGAQGEGQPNWRDRNAAGLLPAPPHDPSGHTWHHPDEQLFAITKYGLAKLISQPSYRTAMPVYDGVLSDAEIIAVLSWIKAQWPVEVRRQHDEINDQYRQSQSR